MDFLTKLGALLCLFLCCFPLHPLQAQPVSGFIQADFNFNGGSLEDESPNMLDASGFGLMPDMGLEGSTNSAFRFNGMDSYINGGSENRNMTDQLSISAWFKTTATADQVIVSKYSEADDAGYLLGTSNGFLRLAGRDLSNTFHELTAEDLEVNDDEWHHVVAVIDGNLWQLYVDCELVAEMITNTLDPQFAGPVPLTIGRNSGSEDLYFSGLIDNVKLYNIPLEEDQITGISPYTCPVDDLSPNRSVLKIFSGDDPLGGRSVVELPSGDLLVVGAVEFSPTVTGVLVCRTTQAGVIIWSNSLSASGIEIPRGVIVTSDGGYAIAGMTSRGGLGAEDMLLIKLDQDGNLLWSKTYGGSLEDRGFGIIETPDDGLLLCGSTRSFGNGQRDAILLKTDAGGNVLWTKTFGGAQNDIFQSILQTGENSYSLLGITVSYGRGNTDIWQINVDAQGAFLNGNAYGAAFDDNAAAFMQTPDGGFLITAHSLSYGFGNYDGLIFKTSAAGLVEWGKVFGDTGIEFGKGVATGQDGRIFYSGVTESAGAGLSDLFLLELASNGDLVEARTYGKSGLDDTYWVGQGALIGLPNGRLLMTGTVEVMGKNELLFANMGPDKSDVCLGQEWDLNFTSALPLLTLVIPGASSPAIQSAELNFTTASYAVSEEYLASDYCPTDLVISAGSTLCAYQASNDITTSGQVEITADISFKAGHSISLQPGFRVLPGHEFSAVIEACTEAGRRETAERLHLPDTAVLQGLASGSARLEVYPNPSRVSFQIELELPEATVVHLSLSDAAGRTVRAIAPGTYLEGGLRRWEIPVHDLPAGPYFLRFQGDREVWMVKVFKVE